MSITSGLPARPQSVISRVLNSASPVQIYVSNTMAPWAVLNCSSVIYGRARR